MDVILQVELWYCEGLPAAGLTDSERSAVIESAQSSFLAEHVAKSDAELQAMDDMELVATHYLAMVDAVR